MGDPLITINKTRGQVLLVAGLPQDAQVVTAKNIPRIREHGMEFELPVAYYLDARAAALLGDDARQRSSALLAAELFRSQGRIGWAARCHYLVEVVQHADGSSSLDRLLEVAADLAETGDRFESTHLRLLAARIARESGDSDLAAAILSDTSEYAASVVDSGVPVAEARAQLDAIRGDYGAAMSTLDEVMTNASTLAAQLGPSELRLRVGAHTVLAQRSGLSLAMAYGDESDVFRWSEWGRTVGSRTFDVRRSNASTRAIRSIEYDIDDASDSQDLARRQSALDQLAAELGRLPDAEAAEPPRLPLLQASLDDSRYIGIGTTGSAHVGTVVHRGAVHVVPLSPELVREASILIDTLRFGTTLGLEDGALDAALRRMDESVGIVPHRGSTIVAPTPSLFAAPWSELPSLVSHPLTVAVSAASWLRGGLPEDVGTATVVAGPDLQYADLEAEAVAREYQDSVVLTGGSATGSTLIGRFADSEVLHVASHGRFTPGNAYFSTLRMHDRDVAVWELSESRSPSVVVLSGCDLGSVGASGDSAVGLVAALLGLGSDTVIAAVAPVPDTERTAWFMGLLHRRLAAGERPAVALWDAKRQLGDRQEDEILAAAFQCFGWG